MEKAFTDFNGCINVFGDTYPKQPMWILVFIFSNLWGNRIGHFIANKLITKNDSPFIKTVIISCCTVLIMCPTMSLVATILFNTY